MKELIKRYRDDWFVTTADDEHVGPGDYVYDTEVKSWGVVQHEVDSEGCFAMNYDNGTVGESVREYITSSDLEYDKTFRNSEETK